MEKQQIISFIEEQIKMGKVSKEDLLSIANVGEIAMSNTLDTEQTEKEDSSRKMIHIFYGIGAIIALVGVVILIGQNWDDIGFMGRLVVSLGISLVTYIYGLLLSKPEQKSISQVMFTVSAILAPLGVYVLLSEANIDFEWPFQFYTAIILTIIFGYALRISKRSILVLFTVFFASWAYMSILSKVFSSSIDSDIIKWSVMLLGLSYILIASGYEKASTTNDISDKKENNVISGVLYGLGTLAVLGAGITIGGVFNIIFIAFIFAAFYGSVYFKSRMMLILGSLFLMGHIGKLTSEYFVDSIGWPVALIIMGFLVIGVGYMTYNLNKNFISKK